MRRKSFLVLACSMTLILAIYITGCGQQETTSTTTTLPAAQMITLSGALASGTISSAGVRCSAAAPDYQVIAINSETGQTYYASTDSSGNFSIAVPPGDSYEISLIDSNSNYFGPVVMLGDASSSEVVMGVTPSGDTDFGQIVLDSSKSMAKPTSEPAAIADPSDTALASNGIPKGAGNYGKTQLTGISTREGSEMDKDGIPNLFDADEDNDGIRNGIASTPTASTVLSNTVEAVMLSSNIWANHGTTEHAQDIIAMRLHVIPLLGHESEIASVEAITVPATIKDVATIRHADSLGSPLNYPAEGSLWKNDGYQLYKTTTLPKEQWIVSVAPHAIMSVGDIFTIRVHYTGGGYQDFFITTSYVLTDWSRILTYNSTSMPTNEGTSQNPVTFSASSLNIEFSKPLDEDGNILNGLSYSIRYATSEYDAGAGRYLVPSNVTETHVADPGSGTLTFTISTITAETYYVTPVAESADGQRNGEEVWFKKI